MVLKLYGSPSSTCTRRVATVLVETNTPFEFVSIDFTKGEHKSPEFVKKQPFGQVPYIDDDGFVLFESRAIARYIAAKAGSPLLPTGDAHAVARFEQAVNVEAFNFDGFASQIAFQRVFAPFFGKKTDEARVEELSTALAGKMPAFEHLLAHNKYVAGDNITIADLYYLPYGSMLAPQGFKFLEDTEKYPNVARWWKEISARPSWLAVKDGVSSKP